MRWEEKQFGAVYLVQMTGCDAALRWDKWADDLRASIDEF